MIEVALADSVEQNGLDFMKALSKHSSRIKFDSSEEIHKFIDYLNSYSEEEREDATYQYKRMDHNQAAPQIQARSPDQ